MRAPPLRRCATLTRSGTNLKLDADAYAARCGLRDDVLGRGDVERGQTERPEERELVVGAPTRDLAGDELAQLSADVRRRDQAFLERQVVLGRLVLERLPAVGEEHRVDDGGGVELAVRALAGPDRVDVRP